MKYVLVSLALVASCLPAQAQNRPALDSTLCWSQLELLQSRNKLTDNEAAVFKAQCTCFEANEQDGGHRDCAQPEG